MSRTPDYFIPVCPWCKAKYKRSGDKPGFGTSWSLWLRCTCGQIYVYQIGKTLKGAKILGGPGKDGWKIDTTTIRVTLKGGWNAGGAAEVVQVISDYFGRFKYNKEDAALGILVGEAPADVVPLVQALACVEKVEIGLYAEEAEEGVEASEAAVGGTA